jgi:hypothetical protein
VFDGHATGRAINASLSVNEDYGNLPERHELEPSRRKLVVAAAAFSAAGTDGAAVGPRTNRHFDRQSQDFIMQARRSVNKGLVTFQSIES